MRTIALLAASLVLLGNIASAQAVPTDAERLQARYGRQFYVLPDRDTGSPVRVYGRFTPHAQDIVRASAADTARNLIARNQDILRVQPENVRESYQHTAPTAKLGRIHRVESRQTVDGVPIRGSRVFFTFLEDNSVLAMGAKSYPDPEVDTVPAVTEGQAVRIALAMNPGYLPWSAELVVLPEEVGVGQFQYRLAWDIRIEGPDIPSPEDYLIPLTYQVDAHTGEIVDEGYGVDFNYTLSGDVDHWRTVDRGGSVPEAATPATETLADPVRIKRRISGWTAWIDKQTTDYMSPTFSYSLSPNFYDLFAYRHTGGTIWAQAYWFNIDLTAGDYEHHVGLVQPAPGGYTAGSHHIQNMWWHGTYANEWFDAQGSTYVPLNATTADPDGHIQMVTLQDLQANSVTNYVKNRISLNQTDSVSADTIIHEWWHLEQHWLYGDDLIVDGDAWIREGAARYYGCRAMADQFYGDSSFNSSGNSINIDTGRFHVGANPLPSSSKMPTNYDELIEPPPGMNPTTSTIAKNAWVTASTLWDIVKHGMPATGGANTWMPDPGWDAVICTAFASYAPLTLEELHLDIETMAYWWEHEEDADGDGLRDATDWREHAHNVFMDHVYPDHTWPLIPPGLPAPALQLS